MLLLEHPPVFTAGKRTEPHERPLDPTASAVIDVDRGGKITFHGPGQLVGYPIVRLPDHVLVVDYVRRVEEALIARLRRPRRHHRPGARAAAASGSRADDARARAQDRRARHPGQPRRDHARVRAQLRRRPRLVRPVRALRHRRRRRHQPVSAELGPRRHRRRGRSRSSSGTSPSCSRGRRTTPTPDYPRQARARPARRLHRARSLDPRGLSDAPARPGPRPTPAAAGCVDAGRDDLVIETTGLRKEFRTRRGRRVVAVDGLDLAVPAGGVHGFLGPNGSGKTTTIRMLLGLARPSQRRDAAVRRAGAAPRCPR